MLVLDLRHANQFVEKQNKFKGVNEALKYAKNGMDMMNKSGYHHIDIHPNFHKYLGFLGIIGETRCFEFNVLSLVSREQGT